MKDDFNYQSVPLNYLPCFNGKCPRRNECLRHLVALHAPESVVAVKALNPAAYPKDTASCPYFRSNRKLRLAWGIDAMFDKIPYTLALDLKSRIRRIYSKSTYYRILHQERPLPPGEQEEIARIFAHNGVGIAPEFDRYTEGYDWDEHLLPG